MYGISSVFKYTQITEEDKGCLQKMNQEMKYRGPDGDGVWSNERCGLTHTRLSIIGVNNGRQPIFNEDHNVVLVCNGEIYNYKELSKRLIRCVEEKHDNYLTRLIRNIHSKKIKNTLLSLIRRLFIYKNMSIINYDYRSLI